MMLFQLQIVQKGGNIIVSNDKAKT